MKAIVSEKYGGPEVFQLKDAEKPVPKDREVLIKVHCTSINPYEWHHLRGKPLFARMGMGFFKPKHTILGADVAGVVEQVGKDVTEFKPGDEVFGCSDYGGLAEYVCMAEGKTLHKPSNLSFAEVAATPIAGCTALQSLRDVATPGPGEEALINGASGGVGCYAVQLAKIFGLHVTGVCSDRNVELVKSLGADRVVDYTKQNVVELGDQYDIVIDNVGNLSLRDFKKLVKKGGTGVMVGFTTMKNALPLMMRGKAIKGKIGILMAKSTKDDMQFLVNLMKEGKVKSVLDRHYPLEETVKAMHYLETLHAPGKVIIQIEGNSVEDRYLSAEQSSKA